VKNTKHVGIIDYGMGNIHSVNKALCVAGAGSVEIISDPERLRRADCLVLPGVGAMGDCISGLSSRGLDSALLELLGKRTLLAVCVGMQVLALSSEESSTLNGLGYFPVYVKRFRNGLVDLNNKPLKIPHMGWNKVWYSPHPMFCGIDQGEWFYFVHSYRIGLTQNTASTATCYYGEPFLAGLARGGVYAVQFHPEKSHISGIKLYRNFLNWDGLC